MAFYFLPFRDAGLADDNPSGAPELMTGDPLTEALFVNRHPISASSRKLTEVSFTFQYILGYMSEWEKIAASRAGESSI